MQFDTKVEDTPRQWYVLRVTYQRELMAKAILNNLNIRTFIPTKNIYSTDRKGKHINKEVAIIHNYIFVYSHKDEIDDIKKNKIPWLRYVMLKDSDTKKRIMTVPHKQMNCFIAVAGNKEHEPVYICPDEIDLKKGDHVRVLGGPFEGVEGIYMKINNKKQKCVVIKIVGIAAVATASIPRILIEKTDTDTTH